MGGDRSGGRSSFTPVAVGFAIAIGLAAFDGGGSARTTGPLDASRRGHRRRRATSSAPAAANLLVAVLGGAVFVVAVALLYGSTLALSPRDGVQPLEFKDEAYYSVLGADLAKTGTEIALLAIGFRPRSTGLPDPDLVSLGRAVARVRRHHDLRHARRSHARHFVVLPILLLAAAALTGTLVRRMTGSTSRGAFLFGFLACLVPGAGAADPGPLFSTWAVGMIFGITLYGLAAVAVLLALYSSGRAGAASRDVGTGRASSGSAAALIVPAHLVIARARRSSASGASGRSGSASRSLTHTTASRSCRPCGDGLSRPASPSSPPSRGGC